MQRNQPFARAIAMMQAIAVIAGLPQWMHQSELAKIGPYVSRGHGRSRYSGKPRGNRSGRTYPMHGYRECARRVRQMHRDGLRTAPVFDRASA